jgi:hypothetical protein
MYQVRKSLPYFDSMRLIPTGCQSVLWWFTWTVSFVWDVPGACKSLLSYWSPVTGLLFSNRVGLTEAFVLILLKSLQMDFCKWTNILLQLGLLLPYPSLLPFSSELSLS